MSIWEKRTSLEEKYGRRPSARLYRHLLDFIEPESNMVNGCLPTIDFEE